MLLLGVCAMLSELNSPSIFQVQNVMIERISLPRHFPNTYREDSIKRRTSRGRLVRRVLARADAPLRVINRQP
jgi:hypothetical protein